ncbi:uncharacterized membrane protein YhaH (DUF805 family) [Janthinobacterium sp. CG_23.3]
MGMFPMKYWLLFMLALVVPALLFSRILPKAGYPSWWALLAMVPGVNLIALYLLAFSAWPKCEQSPN